jgi:cyclic beta-1,2-glucan synthetase
MSAAATGYRATATMPLLAEVRRQASRRRTQLALGFMALLPMIILLAFEFGGDGDDDNGGGAFGSLVDLATSGGLNFALFSILVSSSFLLIVVVALFCGDTVASEASWGSLRYLLAVPVPRARLVAVKLIVALGYSGLALLTLAGTAWLLQHAAAPGAAPLAVALAGLLLLGPVSEAVVAVVNRIISEIAPPAHLPRLALEDGIPAAQRVIVVMPCMLVSDHQIELTAARLERHFIANPEREAQFALLSDWLDAPTAEAAGDGERLATARRAIERLNERHPVDQGAPLRFLLLHRARTWSGSEGRFIGWERKRGKLEHLVRTLSEPRVHVFFDLGALSRPAPEVRHIVTLDADTELPPGALRELVGVAAHPLNLPRIDFAARRLTAGYGVLQPHVAAPLPSPETVTGYHALFNGRPGVDPYSAASSEVYQDLFGEGSFIGKGLLNVAAMQATLAGRLPEGRVLSHDLLEGALARCATVSDIALVEAAPVHADVAASRLHRWTRGDWQLLPFLLQTERYPMPWICRWKMIDNLRRSLVAPFALALVVLALATGVLPLAWALAAVAAAFCAGPLLGALAGLAPSRDDIALGLFYRHALADVARALLLGVWHIAQLLQSGLLQGDAIVRALHRRFISRRRLLEWQTAAAAEAAARTDLQGLWNVHLRVPVVAALLFFGLLGLALSGSGPMGFETLLVLAVWAGSPLWTWLASRPHPRPRGERLAAADRVYLHGVARDTWRYYERHVNADCHHLPPDNVQLVPSTMLAHRTSPTNIGLYVLATACARELGFIGLLEMAERLEATLATLERLPRFHGHFFNWTDTRTLAVLAPGYVSTVDSGNCSASLLAAAVACRRAAAAAGDTAPAQRALALSQQRLRALRPVLTGAPGLRALAEITGDDFVWPANADAARGLLGTARRARAEFDALDLGRADGGEDGPMWMLHDHAAALESALRDSLEDTAALQARLHALAVKLQRMAVEPDFALLYDGERKLLHIGLRADNGHVDDNHYDLLASEARLTSLVAIAKGDLPVAHWAALGRPAFAHGFEVGLKSWSGSMFEYLMPSLLLDEPLGSVLHQMAKSAVHEQRLEARAHGTPWGISESAIAAQDHTLAYQYGPQGVARLALRRTPTDERVVAPYATMLALVVAPAAAVANLRALEALGARRVLGFIEAIDYTPQRQAGGHGVPVLTHMAHHQAMSLAAITDVLTDGAPRHWLMADPGLHALATLLHERPPREVPRLAAALPAPAPRRPRTLQLVAESEPLASALPATQLLTNGRYAVLLREHGSGWSGWEGTLLTRWRDDLARDHFGSFVYLQRERSTERHSLTARPAPDGTARYRCRMQADRVVYEAEWAELRSTCTVWVSAEDDCELRQVELVNRSDRKLELVLSFAAEVTLAPARADEAHPAFSNLFVQAAWDAAEHALYLSRQPRLHGEPVAQAVQFLAFSDVAPQAVEPCTDRARWLGRYGTPARPHGEGGASALPEQGGGGPGMALDTGLDPVAVITVRLVLPAGAAARLAFCRAAARDTETLQALVDKYRQPSHVLRAASMSHTMASIRLREMEVDADGWAALLHLNTFITALTAREILPRAVDGARCDRRLLWRHGISGDRPIVLATISSEDGLPLARALKKALRLWTAAGLGVDLVMVNGEPASYLAPVQQALQALQARHRSLQDERLPADRRATLHLLRERDLGADERHTLHLLARVRLQGDGRPLAQQIGRLLDDLRRERTQRDAAGARVVPALRARPARATHAPAGTFDAEGGDFAFSVSASVQPQRPWTQVLANPAFGCQLTEVGGGYTWAGNSRMHQVTGWSNDPLADPAAEWLLLQDLDSGDVWPLGRWLADGAPRQVVHGIGFTRTMQRLNGIDVTLVTCVDAERSVKQVQVTVRPQIGRAARLRLVAFVEWQMGSARHERASVLTRPDRLPLEPEGEGLPPPATALALQATQADHLGGFGQATAFVALRPAQRGDAEALQPALPAADDWTCDRREFFDAAGRLVLPARLARRSGGGLDPCAALGCALEAAPGQSAGVTLLLGHAESPAAAHALFAAAWREDPAQRLARQRDRWRELTGNMSVHTPDPLFDALVNHWLPYQTVACRLWARAGFYQAGGAFGFRDQLQDAMSLLPHTSALLAEQLRVSAARQFPEGDVQHWWHAPGGAGVRTHFSDDLLWLPYALALYVQRTGDAALLDERIAFLVGGTVPEGAEDLYETPRIGDEQATLYEHAARAVDHSLRSGMHDLPLIGTGDWNDGMNRIGHEGRGESVWLAWFACAVIDGLLPIAAARGDSERVQRWREARHGWAEAIERQAWDGGWYLRAFFDDGSPLGSSRNVECRIDLIAQAWSVLTRAGDAHRARRAMASAAQQLVDGEANLVRLLDPPLQHQRPSAGYIQAYPPGVRENGGQYNHAAVWALMAFAQLGDGAAAWRCFTAMSPAHRSADAEQQKAYQIEPYVMAGDIYTQPPYVGRGGWSWYTGSAGWLLRAALESICGVVVAEGRIAVVPCLPPHWPEATVVVRHGGRRLRVVVCNGEAAAQARCAAAPQARRLQVGERLELASLADEALLVVATPAPAPALPAVVVPGLHA